MNEQPLLDAIAANPDDEMQRLIYADWLEQYGDPWAEVWRSAEFCGAMGWEPWRFPITYFDWWEDTGETSDEEDLPLVVCAGLSGEREELGCWSYRFRSQAIADANRAFILAWCNGWRPTQSDCRGGVRLVGTELETEVANGD